MYKNSNFQMRFPGGRPKALTFSYDDGVQQDIRLVSILGRYGLKGTFNINTGLFRAEGETSRRMTKQQVYDLFAGSPHEVAVHTLTHPWLERIVPALAAYEVLEDRRNIEAMFQTVARGMAYPFGTYSDTVVKVLESCGIAYARTTASTERFDIPADWLRMPATCHHNNPRLFELADLFLNPPRPLDARPPQLFYLWGHSYEFDDCGNWDVIERFAEKMGGKPDVWYATNIEIYNYVQAYRRLEFSADGTRAHNPTATTLFLSVNGSACSIPAGGTRAL